MPNPYLLYVLSVNKNMFKPKRVPSSDPFQAFYSPVSLDTTTAVGAPPMTSAHTPVVAIPIALRSLAAGEGRRWNSNVASMQMQVLVICVTVEIIICQIVSV